MEYCDVIGRVTEKASGRISDFDMNGLPAEEELGWSWRPCTAQQATTPHKGRCSPSINSSLLEETQVESDKFYVGLLEQQQRRLATQHSRSAAKSKAACSWAAAGVKREKGPDRVDRGLSLHTDNVDGLSLVAFVLPQAFGCCICMSPANAVRLV